MTAAARQIFVSVAAAFIAVVIPRFAAAATPAEAGFTNAQPLNVIIDPAGAGRRFDGIGATSGGGATSRLLFDYPEPQRSRILDLLFKPRVGASLQTLKVEIGSDGNSTEGAEPSHKRSADDANYERGYEWWMMKEARKRNPRITLIALAWNYPAWVEKTDSQAAANYLVSFVTGAKAAHGLTIDYLGLWNETPMPRDFTKILRASLDAKGLKTRIISDDSVNSWDIVDAMSADRALRDVVDVIATHYPRFQSTAKARELSAEWNKPLWSSEDGPWGDEWGIAGQQSPPLAELLNRNYILGRMTSTNVWNLVTAYYDIFELPNAGLLRAKSPWSGNYQVTSPLWIVAHTTQFAQPGWKYLDAASALIPGGGSYVTLHSGRDFSTVVETLAATQSHEATFELRGKLKKTVYVWRTTADRPFARIATIPVKGNRFTVTLEPNSVYTLTSTRGQTSHAAVNPIVDDPFPLPYSESFENMQPGRSSAPYLFEANGAFEVNECVGGRSGHCLEQVAPRAPIGWTFYASWPQSGTLATWGDARWNHYRVAADVHVEGADYAALFGRVTSASSAGDIVGYQMRVYGTGRWELRSGSSERILTSGDSGPPTQAWRRAEFIMDGHTLRGRIDGRQLFEITDEEHLNGLAGIGSSWNPVSFDNLEVTPVDARRPVIDAEFLRSRPVALPAAPELLVPVALSHTVKLTWKTVPGATGYRVSIGRQKDNFDKTESVGAVNSFTFRTLTNGVEYYFAVSAVNALGEGSPSTQYAVPTEGP
ncbi:MAG: fibronectin type III domain-containing protein [Pseudomonadota bacterium]